MVDNKELTPDQYKMEVMKQNTARRYAEYEDEIASLQTRVLMLQQELKKQGAEAQNTTLPEVAPPTEE